MDEVAKYHAALGNLDSQFIEFLKAADAVRESGEQPHPPPEVVTIAKACESVWWRVKRGDKSSEDRFRRRLHAQLDDLLQVAQSRFGGEPTRVETIGGLRWHLYPNGPRAGYSGYVERVGEDAPEGHARIVYWLAADGAVQRPASPGYPPGGEVPAVE